MPRPQALLFTLYGDYIRHRGGEAWTGSLVELMALFDVSEQSVRSALSRMSRKGWFKSRRVGNRSYYSLTPKSTKLLNEGAQRIFQPRADEWDGKWYLLTYSIPEKKRHLRGKLRDRLTWLGYAPLNNATWVCPRDLGPEVENVIRSLQIEKYVDLFCADHLGFSTDREIVARCWNLDELNKVYADFIRRYEADFKKHQAQLAQGDCLEPSACFVRRFMLVHEFRTFPYVDPNLPPDLLPDDWLGDKAVQLFRDYHSLLADQANAFVDAVLAKAPKG